MGEILVFNGSPRREGNTSLLVREILQGVQEEGGSAGEIVADRLDLRPCRGCLRCNLVRRCTMRGDDWADLAPRIQGASALVFASPVYFHHLTGSLKILLDRFRSFLHVRITPAGLVHTPWQEWRCRLVLLQCLGSPCIDDAAPAMALLRFLAAALGVPGEPTFLTGPGLAVTGQVAMEAPALAELYGKLGLPADQVGPDLARNRRLSAACRELGRELGR